MSSTAPVIRCQGLARWYGEVQGLSGFEIQLGNGVFGLLGPNGSGKTTLMRLLCGLIRPSRGRVELFGRRVGPRAHELFRRVAYMPGDDIHFEDESAIDFLVLLARLGGDAPRAARSRAEESLARVGLADEADKLLRHMSKGMRQRVKLAQALLFPAELLLLDEPLNGMDPRNRRRVMDLVRAHGESGGTVLMASHVLHEIEAVTDRVVLLHHGRLLAEGRLAEVRELVAREPRRVSLRGAALRPLAARVLEEELVSGLAFTGGGGLRLETRRLDRLLARLAEWGAEGGIEEMTIEDEGLAVVFDLLLAGEEE